MNSLSKNRSQNIRTSNLPIVSTRVVVSVVTRILKSVLRGENVLMEELRDRKLMGYELRILDRVVKNCIVV